MVIAEVSMVPIGTGTSSVSRYVARAVRVLSAEQGLTYQLTPMGTIIEGDLDRIMAVVTRMHQSLFEEGATRVVTSVKIDDRRDTRATMQGKIDSVLDRLL